MIASKRSAAPNVAIHHRMVPNAAASARSCCEHVGESYGESMAAARAKHCENACLSSRTSPSSTVTSEASISAAWNQMECSTPKDEIKEDECMDTAWTDDRHSSYLSCMEEMFVKNMFDREYCSVDICGESASSCEQDCVESRPPSSFFKVMQGGGWQPLPCRRLHSWELPSPAIFWSPWVQHFKSRESQEECQQQMPTATEKIICQTSTAYELEDDDVPEVPDVSSTWVRRINSRSSTTSSSNATSRMKNKNNTGVFDSGRCSSSKKYMAASRQLKHQLTSIDQVVPLRVKIEELGAICKSEQDESQDCSRMWTPSLQ